MAQHKKSLVSAVSAPLPRRLLQKNSVAQQKNQTAQRRNRRCSSSTDIVQSAYHTLCLFSNFLCCLPTIFRGIIFGMCFKKSLCCKCTQLANHRHLAMIRCIKINICTKIFIHILHYQVYTTQYINIKYSNIHIMLSSVYNSIYCIIKCTQLYNYRHVAIILCIQINICAKIFNIYNILSTVYNSIYLHKIFEYILYYQVYTTR